MKRAEEIIARARGLLGTPFRAQGRDPAVGLDCVGVVLHANAIGPAGMPDDYRLSGAHRSVILEASARLFRRVPRTQARRGDVLVLRPGAQQWHLGVWTGDSLIHADLASRRVVERPGRPRWPVEAVLRARTRRSRGG